jgi:hypothetical protein
MTTDASVATEVSVADLFLQDPTELSDADILRIVEYFRAKRATFSVEAAKGNRAPTSKRLLAPAVKVDLGDLDL